jgi:hypothetical protein
MKLDHDPDPRTLDAELNQFLAPAGSIVTDRWPIAGGSATTAF